MKLSKLYFLIVLAGTVLSANAATYYSQGSSDASIKNNWHIFRNGGSGSGKPGNFTAGDKFVIQNGHAMTTSSTWTVSGTNAEIRLESGGSLSVSSGNLTTQSLTLYSGSTLTIGSSRTVTVNNGKSGDDLDIAGTLVNSNLLVLGTGATAVVQNAGTYQHNQNGGTMVNMTWNSGSTCEMKGITNAFPANILQAFHHFTWNCASQSANMIAPGGFTLAFGGNFTITNTNTRSLILASTSNSSLAIGGNFSVGAAATYNMTSGTGNHTIDLGGNLIVSGTLTKTGTGTAAINFTNTTTASFSKSGTLSGGINYTINNGATVDFGTSILSGSGSFTLSSGATMNIGHASGITTSGATGNIQVTGTRTYNTGSNYTYNGATTQVFGNAFPATVNNLTINNGNTNMLLNGSLTVSGTLTLSNGKLGIGANTLNLNGSFSGSSANSLKANGSTSSLTVGGSGTIGALFFDQTTSGTTNRILNLTINRTAQTITLANTLQILGRVTPTAGTLTSAGFLTLISNASTSASIGQIGATADVSGNVTVQTYVPATNRRYRMLSSPLQNFTWSQLSDDIFITGSGGSSNGFDASYNNSASCFTYQESTTGGRGWKAVTSTSTSVSSAVGLYVFIRGDRTLASPQWYMGPYPAQNAVTIDYVSQPINKGTFSPALTYTNTGVIDNDGWNLVGNPYPSPIDWSLLTKSNLSSFFYIYDPNTGSYAASNGSNYIAAGQSFFVQAIGSSPSITFTEGAKVSGTPSSYFKTATTPIAIKMVKDSANADLAWLDFAPGSSKMYNSTEDALKYSNPLLNLSFQVDSAKTVQYNTVPMPYAADTFHLSAAAAPGRYDLVFENITAALPTSKSIFLRDLFTNTIRNLRTNPAYSYMITSDPASTGNRFELIILDPSQLPVEWLSFEAVKSGNNVNLVWSTANEKNNSHFIVERSVDNKNFEAVATRLARGNTNSVSEYAYTHEAAFGNTPASFYYRIRQVDLDAKQSTSAVAFVSSHLSKDIELSVFPNPASGHVTVPAGINTSAITITDLAGRIVLAQNEMNMKSGFITLPVSQLEEGAYFITITSPESSRTLKFVRSSH